MMYLDREHGVVPDDLGDDAKVFEPQGNSSDDAIVGDLHGTWGKLKEWFFD